MRVAPSEWQDAAVLVAAVTLIAMSLTALPSAAHPDESPDHGLNNTTYYPLWAEDADDFESPSDYENRTGSSRPAIQTLANGTDVPRDSPPRAVEQWNRGDLEEFPDTDKDTSIHPPNATLQSGIFIEDAYTSLFAVQPSTRARLSSSRAPLYVAPNGSVLGTVDYRVELPADDTTGMRQVFWSVHSHRINETRVVVDDQVETRAPGSHTPHLEYSAIDEYRGEQHRLQLEADIEVVVRKEIRICVDNSGGSCDEWKVIVEYPTDSLTVSDTVDVVEYDLLVSGFTARYPNRDFGMVVYKNKPWLGYSVPGGDVRGVWRFYSARDEEWDTLVRSTEDGSSREHSPLHPLQVNAYPIETGPTPTPRGVVTILETYGVETTPPTLPSDVHLDVLTEPYTASFGIATRTEATDSNLSDVRAWGLVRGVSVQADERHFAPVSINRSNLTLTVVNKTETTVTVRVQLRDAATGAPINTTDRDGYVVLEGDRVNTSADGTYTETMERPPGGVTARYEPGHWWRNFPGYTGDSATVLLQGTVLHVLNSLYRIGVPVSVVLVGIFIIDRFTGWGAWPPWRKL